jgi:hypothetical protein
MLYTPRFQSSGIDRKLYKIDLYLYLNHINGADKLSDQGERDLIFYKKINGDVYPFLSLMLTKNFNDKFILEFNDKNKKEKDFNVYDDIEEADREKILYIFTIEGIPLYA